MTTFVDTSGWYARIVPADPRHHVVAAVMREAAGSLLTTDYVADETLTLLRSRGQGQRAIQFGRQLFDLEDVRVHFLERSELRRAWEVFRDRPERGWSFTDCTSKIVIERFHIKRAITFDRHFAEFGAITLVP